MENKFLACGENIKYGCCLPSYSVNPATKPGAAPTASAAATALTRTTAVSTVCRFHTLSTVLLELEPAERRRVAACPKLYTVNSKNMEKEQGPKKGDKHHKYDHLVSFVCLAKLGNQLQQTAAVNQGLVSACLAAVRYAPASFSVLVPLTSHSRPIHSSPKPGLCSPPWPLLCKTMTLGACNSVTTRPAALSLHGRHGLMRLTFEAATHLLDRQQKIASGGFSTGATSAQPA